MRTLEHFPQLSRCPVCGTNEDKPCVLVQLENDLPGLVTVKPVHVECAVCDRAIVDRVVGVTALVLLKVVVRSEPEQGGV